MLRVTVDNFLAAVVALGLGFALPLLIAPEILMWTFGLTASPSASFVARELGAALLGLSVIFWAARDPWDLGRQVLLSGLVFNAFGIVVTLGSLLAGVLSTAGWVLFGIHLVLAGGFAYFRWAR